MCHEITGVIPAPTTTDRIATPAGGSWIAWGVLLTAALLGIVAFHTLNFRAPWRRHSRARRSTTPRPLVAIGNRLEDRQASRSTPRPPSQRATPTRAPVPHLVADPHLRSVSASPVLVRRRGDDPPRSCPPQHRQLWPQGPPLVPDRRQQWQLTSRCPLCHDHAADGGDPGRAAGEPPGPG